MKLRFGPTINYAPHNDHGAAAAKPAKSAGKTAEVHFAFSDEAANEPVIIKAAISDRYFKPDEGIDFSSGFDSKKLKNVDKKEFQEKAPEVEAVFKLDRRFNPGSITNRIKKGDAQIFFEKDSATYCFVSKTADDEGTNIYLFDKNKRCLGRYVQSGGSIEFFPRVDAKA